MSLCLHPECIQEAKLHSLHVAKQTVQTTVCQIVEWYWEGALHTISRSQTNGHSPGFYALLKPFRTHYIHKQNVLTYTLWPPK